MARNATGEEWGFLNQRRYALHDRDTKFCSVFRATMTAGGIEPIQLPARSPNFNAYAERWVRSVKQECLSKLILFGEGSLRRAVTEFIEHFHAERNHQGKGNVLLFPVEKVGQQRPRVACVVASASADYLGITAMPHKYFDHAAIGRDPHRQLRCLANRGYTIGFNVTSSPCRSGSGYPHEFTWIGS